MIWRILFLLLASGVVLFLWSQLILPAYQNKPLFPLLDTSRRRARKALKDAREEEFEESMRLQTERVKAQTTQTTVEAERELDEQYQQISRDRENRR